MKKVVLKVPMDSDKSVRKALKLAVQVHGIQSVSADKGSGLLTVMGEEVKPDALVEMLRCGTLHNKLIYWLPGCLLPHHGIAGVVIDTVEEVKVKEEEKKPEEEKKDDPKPEPDPAVPLCPCGRQTCVLGQPHVYQLTEYLPQDPWRWC